MYIYIDPTIIHVTHVCIVFQLLTVVHCQYDSFTNCFAVIPLQIERMAVVPDCILYDTIVWREGEHFILTNQLFIEHL